MPHPPKPTSDPGSPAGHPLPLCAVWAGEQPPPGYEFTGEMIGGLPAIRPNWDAVLSGWSDT